MSSSAIRKGAVLLAGGGVYGTATYFTYMYLQMNKKEGHHSCSCTTPGSTSHVDSPERTLQFQKIASCYDESIGRDEMFMGINWLRRSLLYFHATAGGTILEVGAGTGRNLPYYPKNARVVLTDSSDQMLQVAKQKIRALQTKNKNNNSPSKQPQFAVLQADSAHLDLPDHAFDTVVDTFGLCSYDDPVQVLREMVRVCNKETGKILLLEHGRSKSWEFVTNHLDKFANQHAANWGCVWNRDLDHLLDQVKDELQVDILRKFHFGTTYYIVCRPKRRKDRHGG